MTGATNHDTLLRQAGSSVLEKMSYEVFPALSGEPAYSTMANRLQLTVSCAQQGEINAMTMKYSKLITICVVVALLATFGASAVFGQAMTGKPGDGPGNAVTPADSTVTIEPGQWQWYLFRSQVPVGVEESDKDAATVNAATIEAVLRVQSGSVGFEVWSAEDLNNWRNNADDFSPTGSGTPNESIVGEPLFWQGAFTLNNNYYLIVMNRTSQSATYTLSITGDVAFPALAK
jgi:hypothetical protein